MTTDCKHGDPFCPCQDGDLCHYDGDNPMPAPTGDRKNQMPQKWHKRIEELQSSLRNLLDAVNTGGPLHYRVLAKRCKEAEAILLKGGGQQ